MKATAETVFTDHTGGDMPWQYLLAVGVTICSGVINAARPFVRYAWENAALFQRTYLNPAEILNIVHLIPRKVEELSYACSAIGLIQVITGNSVSFPEVCYNSPPLPLLESGRNLVLGAILGGVISATAAFAHRSRQNDEGPS